MANHPNRKKRSTSDQRSEYAARILDEWYAAEGDLGETAEQRAAQLGLRDGLIALRDGISDSVLEYLREMRDSGYHRSEFTLQGQRDLSMAAVVIGGRIVYVDDTGRLRLRPSGYHR